MEVNIHMEGKPLHYDGSVQGENVSNTEPKLTESFVLTDEMRKNIAGNPFESNN
jgi:hypothetical protein